MLKSLELFGFKSFADRTTFEFADGVTCVVGPNGSGKSNVVDALKWILGDQSPKSLRGQEMSDVIFNGSAGRKASNFAEATLTFDNSRGLLPIEASEIQIGRRLYVSGDSEYLLNRNVVRLRDVRELFLGTGAGTAAYSIIEQGRVDQILQANPTTRRLVFEEAAGISRFKARKLDAGRRLERVDQNLLRLRDIVDQLEARLNATRSQASKAAKYREYATEYERLWTGLAADDYRGAAAQLNRLQAELDQQNEAIAAADEGLARCQRHLTRFDAQASDLDEQFRAIERRRSVGREAIAGHQSAIRHQSTQQRELAAEIERLRSQRNLLRRQFQSVGSELDETTARLSAFEQEFNEQRAALARRDRRIGELSERLDEVREVIGQRQAERERLLEQSTAHAQQRTTWQFQLEAATAAGEQAAERAAALGELQEAAAAEREARNKSLHAAEQAAAAAQARIDHARQGRRRLRTEQGASERQLADWREQRSAKVARRQLLDDLEARHEGLNLGVREILQLAASSQEQPWNLVRGNVGELLQAELDDAPLLEVALGSRVQLLVIDDLAPMIEFLNTAIADVAGRVGFIEVPSEDDFPPADPVDLSGHPGVMARADRLVTETSVPLLAERLLADTWVVETLDVAQRLAVVGRAQRCRFVTLQGELLEADGALFVGNAPRETAVISRKSELRLLRNEIRSLITRIETEEQSLETLDASLLETDAELAELQSGLTQRTEELVAQRSVHAAQAAERDRLQAQHAAEDETIQTLQRERQNFQRKISDLEQTMATEEAAAVSLAESIQQTESAAAAISGQLYEQQQAVKVEQLELAKHEERLSALQATNLRLEEDRRHRRDQVGQADAQLIAAQAKQWEITCAILNARAALAELFLRDEARGQDARGLHRERDQLRDQRQASQREQDHLREQRRDLTESVHRVEIQTRDLRHTMNSLSERIEEEFGLDLTKLVERGLSAYRAWVKPEATAAEQRPSAEARATVVDNETHEEPTIDFGTTTDDAAREADSADIDEASATIEEVRGAIEERIERLRRKIKNLGSVNADSLKDLDELESRHSEFSGQLADLEAAQDALEDIIRRINVESRRLFLETFESIRGHFQELYRKLFGGGEGDIVLEDPDDVLECGIDIVARPPGKELRSISLLSGGEKTMTAVALLFAMFRSKPSPYCILDEVDASLDEANVDRYLGVVKEFRESTQFVIITHRKRTMTAADRLYGVTMEQAGVSKRLTVQFEDVREDGHIGTDKAAA